MKNITEDRHPKVQQAIQSLKSNIAWKNFINNYIRKEYEDIKEALVENPDPALSGQGKALKTILNNVD